MLTAEVVGEADMKLVALTMQREFRLRRFIKSDIIHSICSLVVDCYYVLANDCVEDFTLVVAASGFVGFSDHANLVQYAESPAHHLVL